jgi:hypothetical protein
MKPLFGLLTGGGDDGAAQREAQRQREVQAISQSRADEAARAQQSDSAAQLAAGKVTRGRRLLTGDGAAMAGGSTLGSA